MVRNFVKRILHSIDSRFGASFTEEAVRLEKFWNGLNLSGPVRRRIGYFVEKLKFKLGTKKAPLKLHLGCGIKCFDGYKNIDWRKTEATDLVCDITKLPYPNGSVGLIETYHVIEHLSRHDLPKALKEWYRVLLPGGKLIIECPDFDASVREYLEGNEKRLDSIFGLQRFPGDTHQFGYSSKGLKNLLITSGFKNIRNSEAQDSHAKDEPCLRVECIKDEKH